MTLRLCEPGCPFPDQPHRAPELDWIGDTPIAHGESPHPVPGTVRLYDLASDALSWVQRDNYCLCGHPDYWTCPAWLEADTVATMTIHPADGVES